MKNRQAAFTISLFVSLGAVTGSALAQDRLVIRHDVVTFAVLPDGVRFPEGITANPANSDIYVGTPDGSFDTITFGDIARVPNATVFDSRGNLYISDSFQGAIFRIDDVAHCHTPCFAATVAHDPLLATTGFPPFGANGLAFNSDESALFVANTGDDRVLKITN